MKINRKKAVKPVHHTGAKPADFAEFSAWISESGLLESTQAKYVFAVRLFFRCFRVLTQRNINMFFKDEKRRWALDGIRQYVKYVECDLELPKIDRPPAKERVIPSFEELERILKSIRFEDEDTMWALKTCFVTGAGRLKVLSINYKDIVHKDKAVKIPGQGKISIEPIYEKLIRFLRDKGLHNSERLFYTKSVSVAAAAHALRYHTERLKTSKKNRRILLRTHNFRRALRDELLVRSDYNITVVQMRIGDADPKTTMSYVPDIQKERAKEIGQDLLFGGKVYE